jgi:glucose/arabinose dehydrogenase
MKTILPRVFRSRAVQALAFGALGLTAAYVLAQQKPPTPQEVEARKAMGGYFPDRMKNPHLTGNPPKLTVTPLEEIPLKDIQVPPGFQVEIWAHGMPGNRMMTRGDRGTVFAGTRAIGRVYAIMDKGGSRTHKIIAEKLNQPNGVLFHNGSLYVAAIHRVFRYDNIEASLAKDVVPEPVDMTDAFKLPTEAHHNWKFLALGPDKKIYFQVGSPCNVCEINKEVHGQIRRYNLDGTGMEIVARGVRNSVGFDFHPKTGELWFTDNGRDWAGEEGFEEELNRVPANRIGANFGFPLLPRERPARPGLQDRQSVRRCHSARSHPRRARRRPGHAVLHRQDVPRRILGGRTGRPPRLLEQDRAQRLRRRDGQGHARRQER